jgi:hypothetical protein
VEFDGVYFCSTLTSGFGAGTSVFLISCFLTGSGCIYYLLVSSIYTCSYYGYLYLEMTFAIISARLFDGGFYSFSVAGACGLELSCSCI